MDEPKSLKVYLGDGVYADVGAWAGEFILTTEDGINVTNTIVLDDTILQRLIEWREYLDEIQTT